MSSFNEEEQSNIFMDGYSEGFFAGYMQRLYEEEHNIPCIIGAELYYKFKKYEPYTFVMKEEKVG